MNTSPKLIKGLGACLLQKGTFQSPAAQPAVRPSRSSALPGRWEPLGAPSHAGVPDDSAVFCGESIWAARDQPVPRGAPALPGVPAPALADPVRDAEPPHQPGQRERQELSSEQHLLDFWRERQRHP